MFYDKQIKNYPVTENLLSNFDEVRREILSYVDARTLIDYPMYQVRGKPIYENYWKATPCSLFQDEHIEISGTEEVKQETMKYVRMFRQQCPLTYAIIQEDEDAGFLRNSFISRLIPGSIINPHGGWADKFIRIHLGIVTDPDCRITVDEETRTWEEGKILAFFDRHNHSVVHNGTKERIVFSFDVLREHIQNFMTVELPAIRGPDYYKNLYV